MGTGTAGRARIQHPGSICEVANQLMAVPVDDGTDRGVMGTQPGVAAAGVPALMTVAEPQITAWQRHLVLFPQAVQAGLVGIGPARWQVVVATHRNHPGPAHGQLGQHPRVADIPGMENQITVRQYPGHPRIQPAVGVAQQPHPAAVH